MRYAKMNCTFLITYEMVILKLICITSQYMYSSHYLLNGLNNLRV